MATQNVRFSTTIQAKEDLNTSAFQYHAIALVDGLLANNGEETSGILLNKPKSGEFLSLGYIGELKFAAGLAISKGAKLTVTTSGWFTTADSNDPILGEAKATVTSGSLGTGLFNIPTGSDKSNIWIYSMTSSVAMIAGTAMALNDHEQADLGIEANAVALGAAVAGTARNFGIAGVMEVRLGPAVVCTYGDNLTVTTSGYFTPVASGDYSVARALENIGSADVGAAIFLGGIIGAVTSM